MEERLAYRGLTEQQQEDLRQECLRLIKEDQGSQVRAVKHYRNTACCGLPEALNAVKLMISTRADLEREALRIAVDALENACRARYPNWDDPLHFGAADQDQRRAEIALEVAAVAWKGPRPSSPGEAIHFEIDEAVCAVPPTSEWKLTVAELAQRAGVKGSHVMRRIRTWGGGDVTLNQAINVVGLATAALSHADPENTGS